MTPQAVAVVAVIGVLVWLALAVCLAIAICLTIREADRRRPRPTLPAEPPAPSVARVHHELYGEWLGDGDPSGIRPPTVPPRLDVRL